MPQVKPPHPSAARTDRLQTGPIVAIGASTGGTEALRILLQTLPPDGPPLLIVQHMPEGFTAPFARRLDGASRLTVREARPGDRPLRGHAFIAPANRHMLLRRSGPFATSPCRTARPSRAIARPAMCSSARSRRPQATRPLA